MYHLLIILHTLFDSFYDYFDDKAPTCSALASHLKTLNGYFSRLGVEVHIRC